MTAINKSGKYVGRAVEIMLTESAQKGTPGVKVNFRVTKGEFEGAFVRYDGWITEKTAERVVESLQHCGWEGENIGEFADMGLHGVDTNEVELVVEMEPYQGDNEEHKGKSFPRVAFVNRVGGRGLNVEQAMSADKAASLGERMRGLVIKSKLKRSSGQDSGTDFPYGANAPAASPPPMAAAGGKRF